MLSDIEISNRLCCAALNTNKPTHSLQSCSNSPADQTNSSLSDSLPNNQLKIATLNIRGAARLKWQSIKKFFNSNELDILFLQETKITNQESHLKQMAHNINVS